MAAPRWQWQQQSPNWQLLQGQSQQFPAFQQGAQSLVPVYCFQLSNGAQEGGCGPRVEFSGSQQSTAAESGPEFSGSKQSRAAESGPGFHRGYGEKISVGVQTTRFAEVGVQTDDIWPERSSEAEGAHATARNASSQCLRQRPQRSVVAAGSSDRSKSQEISARERRTARCWPKRRWRSRR